MKTRAILSTNARAAISRRAPCRPSGRSRRRASLPDGRRPDRQIAVDVHRRGDHVRPRGPVHGEGLSRQERFVNRRFPPITTPSAAIFSPTGRRIHHPG